MIDYQSRPPSNPNYIDLCSVKRVPVMASIENAQGKVLSPSKLAHVVLQTNNFEHMKRFYVQFLGGRLVKESGPLAFITYDDEHHRIALIGMPCKDKDAESSGLAHIAFTFDTLKDLCTAYKQRKALGIEPGWCVVSEEAKMLSAVSLTTTEPWPNDFDVLPRSGWQPARDTGGQL